ncbi:hypothetical protein AWB68_00825 [Caballeronia choica]|uniref:HTH-like domain-containing protein n=1 Tax=Caballeronia choica TaxID=326476 RepID=A0A158FQ52_9BURK|nr:hypothetical protein AWB68_00825 [Caballeronia choica]
MSGETSAGAGKPYGLERVCRVLEFARSTLYAQQARESATVLPLRPQRRGPKPKLPDAELLAAIRADLAASPFTGEGHRKVWARLRILGGIRFSRARVLRLMRENALLSPHRVTRRPNEMWGTDGIRIETVDEGWVWVFSPVDHFDACCVGIHAVKTGNRFAASQPIAQGLQAEFSATGADAGRGLTMPADQRASSPVGGDVAEHAVLDLVPFAGARRKMTDLYLHLQFIGQVLQLPVPQAHSIAVAAAAVGGNQQAAGVLIHRLTHFPPPAANALDGKFCGVVIDADVDPSGVRRQVIDAIGRDDRFSMTAV